MLAMTSYRYARAIASFAGFRWYGAPTVPEREMRLLIDLERERCDRGGNPFALVEFRRADGDRGLGALTRGLSKVLHRRMRRIDVVGRLDRQLAVLMPNTDEDGARKAIDDALAAAPFPRPPAYIVSVYPRPGARPTSVVEVLPERFPEAARPAAAGAKAHGRALIVADADLFPMAPLVRDDEHLWKRLVDIGGAAVMLLFLSPLLAACALYLRLRDPGPVLFRQRRIGWQGRPFLILKLRTMRVDADEAQHQRHLQSLIRSNERMTKLDSAGDPRIIPGAEMMRKLGIDELPQLINVLRGEMSLVGPRPCLAYEAQALEPWQRARFKVRPGLTGAWQVNGKNRTTFRRMLQLDVGYTHAPRLWNDIVILLRTLPAVIGYARNPGEGTGAR